MFAKSMKNWQYGKKKSITIVFRMKKIILLFLFFLYLIFSLITIKSNYKSKMIQNILSRFAPVKLPIKCLFNNTEIVNITRSLKSTAKVHIVYLHYLNTNDEYTIENFKFFIHFAYEPCHSDVDFTIILNLDKSYIAKTESIINQALFRDAFDKDGKILEEFKSCQNPSNPRRNTYLLLRENKPGGDLCAYSHFVKSKYWLDNKSSYSYYFFINSSARCPFMPNYYLKKW